MIRTYEIDFDDALVDSASEIFETLGTDIDTAINMFLRQAVLRKGFPFRIVIPGADEGSEAEEREEPSAVPPVSQEVAARVEANEALVAAMRSEIGDKAVTPEFDENEDDGTHGDYDAAPSPESDGIATERGAAPELEITVGSEIMPEPAIADKAEPSGEPEIAAEPVTVSASQMTSVAQTVAVSEAADEAEPAIADKTELEITSESVAVSDDEDEAEPSDEPEIAAEPVTVSEPQMAVVTQAVAESETADEHGDETEPAIAAEIEINAELAATTEPEIASESSPATELEITSESVTAVSDDEDEAEPSDEPEIAAEPATVSEPQMTVVTQTVAESESAAEPEDETEPAIVAEIEINAEPADTTEPEIASESSPATEPEITSESVAVSDDEDEDEAAPENLFDSWDVGEEEDVGCR